jgi:hypothetical protein
MICFLKSESNHRNKICFIAESKEVNFLKVDFFFCGKLNLNYSNIKSFFNRCMIRSFNSY